MHSGILFKLIYKNGNINEAQEILADETEDSGKVLFPRVASFV